MIPAPRPQFRGAFFISFFDADEQNLAGHVIISKRRHFSDLIKKSRTTITIDLLRPTLLSSSSVGSFYVRSATKSHKTVNFICKLR